MRAARVRPRRAARRRRALAPAAAGLVLAAVAWCLFLVFPAREELRPADAIVMLAGADDGRHAHAVALADEGLAPNLVVSNPEGRLEPIAWSTCHGDRRPDEARTWCVPPDPVTTAGEAVTIDRLARRNGWRSVIVVTNRPHTARARWTFERCTGLDVQMAPIEGLNRVQLPIHLGRETLGFVSNALRGCPG